MNQVNKIELNKFYEYKFKDECPVQFKVVFLDERDIAIWTAPSVHCLLLRKRDFKKEIEDDDLQYFIEISRSETKYDFGEAMFLDNIEESPEKEWVMNNTGEKLKNIADKTHQNNQRKILESRAFAAVIEMLQESAEKGEYVREIRDSDLYALFTMRVPLDDDFIEAFASVGIKVDYKDSFTGRIFRFRWGD